SVLKIACAPITWPIASGKEFKGVYHILRDEVIFYKSGMGHTIQDVDIIKGIDNPELDKRIGYYAQQLRDEMELVQGASHEFDRELFLKGELTPVFFGTALGNFRVAQMLERLTAWAPAPQSRASDRRTVAPTERRFAGSVFRIQGSMDPTHRDRVAFLRIVSGKYEKGM